MCRRRSQQVVPKIVKGGAYKIKLCTSYAPAPPRHPHLGTDLVQHLLLGAQLAGGRAGGGGKGLCLSLSPRRQRVKLNNSRNEGFIKAYLMIIALLPRHHAKCKQLKKTRGFYIKVYIYPDDTCVERAESIKSAAQCVSLFLCLLFGRGGLRLAVV